MNKRRFRVLLAFPDELARKFYESQSAVGAKVKFQVACAELVQKLLTAMSVDSITSNRPDLRADETWPETGAWRLHGYAFRVAPFPGQTLWSCVFAARIDGRVVAFTGNTFQPASRWNGTGGFSAYNRSLFRDGSARSAPAPGLVARVARRRARHREQVRGRPLPGCPPVVAKGRACSPGPLSIRKPVER